MATRSTRFNVLAAIFSVLCFYQSALLLDSAGIINAQLIRPLAFRNTENSTVPVHRGAASLQTNQPRGSSTVMKRAPTRRK